MGSPDTANISTGPGLLYYAPLGTTEPTDRTTDWPSGWVPLGYTAEGHSFSANPTIADVEVAELLQPVRRITTRVDNRIQFALAEMTAAHYKLVLNGGTITPENDTVTDGATTNADATVTSASAAFTADDVGMAVTGAGIPAGATIITINSANSVELSAAATATAAGVTLTFVGRLGSYFEPPEVAAQIRHMLGWDAEDGEERLVIRQSLQGGNLQIPRRKGAEFARLTADFALEQPGGGLTPYRQYFARSRVAA